MYLIRLDGTTYERKGGGTFTLVEAMQELHGCRGASVLREDGTLVVRNAGSTASPWEHVPSGRQIRHRLTRWARERWLAEMDVLNAERRATGW